ncbi:MAG TPA: hypothetical protein VGG24_17970 [Paraburkholderia sp.]|jgi:hypothetical protein
MTWKLSVAAVLVAATATAHAQGVLAPPPVMPAPVMPPPPVHWVLEVIRDGQQIDSFEGTTTVGQASTDTHHHPIAHGVGCLDHPAGEVDLSRTISVSPTQASPAVVWLAIDAQETLEGDNTQVSPEGCRLPPQPREVNASHPGLRVPAGQWATWQLVERDPSLMYRVRASIVPPPGQ